MSPRLLCRLLVAVIGVGIVGCPDNPPGPGPSPAADVGAPDIAPDGDGRDADSGAEVDWAPATDIATGGDHSCAIVDGDVWCWGLTHLDIDSPLHVPTRLDQLSDVVQVDAEFSATCALTSQGAVSCWNGSLRRAPTPIEGIEPALMVATADLFGCAVHENGELSCWDHFLEVQTGDVPGAPPLDFPGKFLSEIDDAEMIAAGNNHICVLHEDATVSCWGYDYEGEIGDGVETDDQATPRGARLPLDDVVLIEAGWGGTCAIHRDGGVSCWGRASRAADPTRPARVDGLEEIVDLAVGPWHACALGADGFVSCWQTRSPDEPRGTEPARVDSLQSVVAVETDGSHICVRTEDDAISCWGDNSYGQLGLPAPLPVRRPMPVGDLTDVARVVPGGCALRQAGDVWCWGGLDSAAPIPDVEDVVAIAGDGADPRTCAIRDGGEMLCWFGPSDFRPTFPLPGDAAAEAIAVGHGQRCAIYDGGSVACWGDGADVVDGYVEDAYRPRPVDGFDDVIEVSVGREFACARRRQGSVACWGRNKEGQLGIGVRGDPVASMVDVPELAGAEDIALGVRHGCALLDGEMLCWGNHRADTPTPVEGLADVTAIGAGGHIYYNEGGPGTTTRTCAVADGEVWCWGREILGGERWRIEGVEEPVELAVGKEDRYCALQADGRVVCWGNGFIRPDGIERRSEPVVVDVPPGELDR